MLASDRISLLMCVHSTDEWHDSLLERALNSIWKQSRRPDEVVIVQNACWPATQKVLDRFKELFVTGPVIIVDKPDKNGLASAKNVGLKYCTSEWVTYLDADDFQMPCRLEVQRNFAIQNPSIDFIFCQAWDIRVEDGLAVPNCFPIGYACTHEEIANKIWKENCCCHGSALIRKSAIDSLSGYEEDKRFLGFEDWRTWQRGFAAGYKFAIVPERLYFYQLSSGVAR
jgi:glycosyltransferase involved in cell wall biosynthesis